MVLLVDILGDWSLEDYCKVIVVCCIEINKELDKILVCIDEVCCSMLDVFDLDFELL